MSDSETVVAEAVLEGTPILNPDEFVSKGFINMIRFRINHNILFLQNHIQMLETQLLQEQAKIRVLEEVLGEEINDSENDDDDTENTESDESNIFEGAE